MAFSQTVRLLLEVTMDLQTVAVRSQPMESQVC